MKVCFVVAAHHQPRVFGRLMRSICWPNADVLVHIDRRSELEEFRRLAPPNVHFIKNRRSVHWGGWSQVEVSMELLRFGLEASAADYFIPLAGTDFPIQRADVITEFLRERHPANFLNHYPLVPGIWGYGLVEGFRLNDLRGALAGMRGVVSTPDRDVTAELVTNVERSLNALSSPRVTDWTKLYHGSSRWCLNRETVKYVVDFYQDEASKQLRDFLALCANPDEIFVPTAVLNSAHKKQCVGFDEAEADEIFAGKRAPMPDERRVYFHYIDWNPEREDPAILVDSDFEPLKASGKFFACKFTDERSHQLLDRIESELLGQASAARASAPQVSIVVSVFNKDKYLRQCLQSLLTQSLFNIEIICVDDASTDASPTILEVAAAADPRVRVIRNPRNVGASQSRNIGIAAATGKFIRVMDADDLLPRTSTEALYQRAIETGADLVKGSLAYFELEEPTHHTALKATPERRTTTLKEERSLWVPWWHTTYLISTELIRKNKLAYPSLRHSEDPVFVASALVHARTMSLMAEVVYLYRRYPKTTGSAASTFSAVADVLASAGTIKSLYESYFEACWNEGYGPFIYEDLRALIAKCRLDAAQEKYVVALGQKIWGAAARSLFKPQAAPSREREYWNKVFASRDPWDYSSAYEQQKFQHTLELLPAGPIPRALELGCAEGVFTVMLAPRVGHLSAVDISDTAIDRAKARCAEQTNVTFIQHDIASGLPGDRYDLIVCSEILYYLQDQSAVERFAAQVCDVLVPGGHVLLTHPNMVSDDRSQTGFDFNEMGAKGFGAIFTAQPALDFTRELRTDLYRVQLFRRLDPAERKHAGPEIIQRANADFDHPGIKRGGCDVTAAEARHCWLTKDVPVLMYHRVASHGPPDLAPYRVSPQEFERQLAWLQRQGYHSIDLDELFRLRFIEKRTEIPGKPIVLTFDDAYADFYLDAWPLLRRYGFCATVFVPTDYVGRAAEWDAPYGLPAPLMSWPQMLELSKQGVRFGSHSCGHKVSTTLSGDALLEDATKSRALLREHLGIDALGYCYPFTVASEESERTIAHAGYRYAVGGPARAPADRANPMYIPRIEIEGSDTIDAFVAKLPQVFPSDATTRARYEELKARRDRRTYMDVAVELARQAESLRVVALIAAYNEADIISAVIGHLVENGVQVYLIDNHSTDDTIEQAKRWLGKGLIGIESFPPSGPQAHFEWAALLERKEQLAQELEGDWFIHHDADEIRESPWPDTTLKEAIEVVDRLGYNCIDFRTLDFRPIDDGFKQGDDPRTYFKFYEECGDYDRLRFNCWKRQPFAVSLAAEGGHNVQFPGRRPFPMQFLMRHYPIRGRSHASKKVFAERLDRYSKVERERGWHVQYDRFTREQSFVWEPSKLQQYDPGRIRRDLVIEALGKQALKDEVELRQSSPVPSLATQTRCIVVPVSTRDLVTHFYFDAPRSGVVIAEDAFEIIGWALGRPPYVPHRVKIYCDGETIANGSVAVERPDVARDFPGSPGARHSGFRLAASLAGSRGRSILQVVIELKGPESHYFEQPIANIVCERGFGDDSSGSRVEPAPQDNGPRVVLVDLAQLRRIDAANVIFGFFVDRFVRDSDQTFFLEGWILAEAGYHAQRVELRCNGRLIDSVAVSLPRPDVAKAHPGIEGADNSGFRLSGLTELLPPAFLLTLSVSLVDGSGGRIERRFAEVPGVRTSEPARN